MRNRRSRSGVRSLMDRDGCDQVVVGAYEDVLFNDRVMLGMCETIVIACDCSRSDVNVFRDIGITDVRKVWYLAACTQR